MLYYRGDKFVKGKKFTINESVYKFIKKTKNNELVFESIEDNSTLKILESEFTGVETLIEKIVKYNLVEADDAKLDEFYNDSSLTFEGCAIDKDNIDFLYKWLKGLGCIKEGSPLDIYHYTGSLMNNKYRLTGSNRYPKDLNIITVMLKDIAYNGRLPLARMELGGRWFDDIVENNKRREGMNESVSYSNQTLLEKINQTNKEMNELIGKILRSKALARKNEELLAKHGIKIDYSQGQGVTLYGPNGKSLRSSTKEVEGPTKPGHNETHRKQDSWSTSRRKAYIEYRDEALAKLERLQAMDRDDIIRKYNDKSTEEALAAYAEQIKMQKENIARYEEYIKDYEDEIKRDRDRVMRTKRAGHKGSVNYYTDKVMNKDTSNEKVDYLNYLTKADLGNPTKSRNAFSYVGDSKQIAGSREGYYSSHYYGKHGQPQDRTEKMNKYDELKYNISAAQRDIGWSSVGSAYGYKSEEDLEKEIQAMRDELEAKIERLRAGNEANKARNAKDIEKLQAREKELDDYLKSLGIRESARTAMVKKAMLVEAAKLKESSYSDIYGEEVDYTEMRKIVDAMRAICDQAEADGFNFVDKFTNAVNAVSDIVMDLEEFYENK